MRASVVIATYNRKALLERLLGSLAAQTLPAADFEVIVVDDGSSRPVADALAGMQAPYRLELFAQRNSGPAAARHAGALRARGELLVFVDDDMEAPPGLLAAHLEAHRGRRVAVMGRIRAAAETGPLPLFERYRAFVLDRMAAEVARGRRLRGNNLCTGNLSLRRADYLAVGGFDLSLRLSEDAELGLRLEQAGVALDFSEQAFTLHDSDHADVARWLAQSQRYGATDLSISRKHPKLAHADPWRYLFSLHALLKPFAAGAVAAPGLAHSGAEAAMALAALLDRARLDKPALRATGLAYALEYFRGIRGEAGSLEGALSSCSEFLARAAESPEPLEHVPAALGAVGRSLRDLRQDLLVRRRYELKYGYQGPRDCALPAELVQKIGLQIAAAYRLMRLLREAGLPLLAKATSRLIRHLYGSDIHWDAELLPGVMFVHGMGLAISGSARVGSGCILNQNVTLGMGRDASSGKSGAPRLGEDVHVGAGATLIGPIEIGARTKIMPGVVITSSIPANSIVEAPEPVVRVRNRAAS